MIESIATQQVKQKEGKMKRNKSSITQVSISIPNVLVEQIDKMAAADNRNRSNFIANTLAMLTKERLGKAKIEGR